MPKIIWQVVGGILGIFLADRFISGVSLVIIPGQSSFFGFILTDYWQILFLIGGTLGLINFFVKPILDKITLPLQILTFGFFSLILNMALIWFLDFLFLEFDIMGLVPLFWATLICWGITFLLRLK